MPRGEKSKYTDKQERKADHIAEGTRTGVSARKPSAVPGPPSIRTMAAARTPVDPAAARTPVTLRRTRAARRAERRPPTVLLPSDRHQPRRLPRRANAMPGITLTDDALNW